MESDPNRNEYAQESLASNRLRDTIAGVFAENADRLISKTTTENLFRSGKIDRKIICVLDNGLQFLIDYEEESRKQKVFYWHIKVETLDTERLSHEYRSLITRELIVLSNQGLPFLFREGPVPNMPSKLPFLFPYGEVAPAEILEDLRQGIQSSYILPLSETQVILEQREKGESRHLKKSVCHSIGGYAMFMTGVKFRTRKSKVLKDTA